MPAPSFSLTATERVLPRLALDFTTASLDARVSISRALNTATRFNSQGVIEAVNANLPRFDFDPATLLCRGLLIEETRSNVCLHSQNFASWFASSASAVANTTVNAPDGTLTAFDIQASATTGRMFQAIVSFTGNGTKTISLFFRKGTSASFRFLLRDNTTATNVGRVTVTFSGDTPSGSFDIGTGTLFPIQTLPNGWYRLAVSIDGVVAANVNQVWVLPSVSVANTTLTVWGVQAEDGAFPTSYVVTTTTSVVRNADVATMTSTNFSGWWQATTGSAAVRALQVTVGGTSPVLQFDDNTANNIIALRGNTTNPELYIKATTDQTQIDAGTIAANTVYTLAATWNTNNCAAAVNGNATVSDTSATIPTVTQARLGSDGTNYLNGHLQTVRFWPQRIIDAEVVAFSKM